MGKAFGILLIVVAVWVGMEVYTEGMHGAFGGRLAFLAPEAAPGEEIDERWAGERAADAFRGARDRRIERVERQAGDR
ncbi:MAG: hypothetical protein R3263_00990 [Myxococcota bacterium]|nr:hypothetical protein [Myxococcota bacterium]